jgi:hypothetical protein
MPADYAGQLQTQDELMQAGVKSLGITVDEVMVAVEAFKKAVQQLPEFWLGRAGEAAVTFGTQNAIDGNLLGSLLDGMKTTLGIAAGQYVSSDADGEKHLGSAMSASPAIFKTTADTGGASPVRLGLTG